MKARKEKFNTEMFAAIFKQNNHQVEFNEKIAEILLQQQKQINACEQEIKRLTKETKEMFNLITKLQNEQIKPQNE